MNTAERLSGYYDFDPAVTEAVSQAAAWQNRKSFAELADIYGIGEGSTQVPVMGHEYPLEVLRFTPARDYDESKARVLHTSFNYGVNDNTAMHAMRLFGADSTEQLIVIGTPTSLGNPAGRMASGSILRTYRENTLRPAAQPIAQYLQEQKITHGSHVGYWYGADRAATTMEMGPEFDHEATAGVLVEPVSIVKRSMLQLARDFGKSGAAQKGNVAQASGRPYDEVWSRDSPKHFALWAGGFLRASNLAIAKVLAEGGFEQRVSSALEANQDARVTIGWGTASELVPDDAAQRTVESLQDVFGQDRVAAMRIKDMRHAAVDDIDLNAAYMLQGLNAK